MSTICLISDLTGALSDKAFSAYLFEKLKPETKIAFVPTSPKGQDTKSYAEEIVAALQALGKTFEEVHIFDWEATDQEVTRILESRPVVFLMGGNPKRQNAYLQRLPFQSHLQGYSGMVIGMSAGALNSCPQIEFTKENPRLVLAGLNLHPYYVDVHYQNPRYEEEGYNLNRPHYKLCDTGALTIENKKLLIFGDVYHVT